MAAETTTAETPPAGTTDAAPGRLRNRRIKQRKPELGAAFVDPERELSAH